MNGLALARRVGKPRTGSGRSLSQTYPLLVLGEWDEAARHDRAL